MALEDCPLPELLEGLRPYIKPRDEVLQIRERLQDEVQSQLRRDATLSSITLPDARLGLKTPSAGTITGVRKAYLKALQAHAAAQSRYEGLKADLEKLTVSSSPVGGSTPASVNEFYIPLLRQREKQRKLHVIERTFFHIDDTGKAALDGHLDDIVKQRTGDLPTPPTTQAPSFSDKLDVESRILELKKAVLSTKRAVDAQSSGNGHAHTNGVTTGADAQIAGLQAALNELTGWMEHQLAIIGDAEAENQNEVPSTPGQANGHAEVASMEDIEALYDDYVAARQSLIQTISHPQDSSLSTSSPELSSTTPRSSSSSRTTAAETLLPYLDRLRAAKTTEGSLRQQTTHLRRQITTSESETLRLVSRLADESHMVQPGASSGRDWSDAARESNIATAEHVQQKIAIAGKAVEAAQGTLEETKGLPAKMDVLSTTSQ